MKIKNFYSLNWVFLPGMDFQDNYKWWKPEKRKTPHEGVDFYQHLEGRINEKTRIPSLTNGRVTAVFKDFLGKTVVIQNQNRIYIYSHINPEVKLNQNIKQNQIIGTPSKSENPPTHLHLTIAQIPKDYPIENLDWNAIKRDKEIKLIDPKRIIT